MSNVTNVKEHRRRKWVEFVIVLDNTTKEKQIFNLYCST
jgi:hypothetical protein